MGPKLSILWCSRAVGKQVNQMRLDSLIINNKFVKLTIMLVELGIISHRIYAGTSHNIKGSLCL